MSTAEAYDVMLKPYPDALTLSEVAEILRCERHHAAKIIKAGILPARKASGKYLIAKIHVVEFLNGGAA